MDKSSQGQLKLRHLSFRLLEVYVQVVRLGNISAAARTLHLTQPTVSLQLKKLADILGEPLLNSIDGRMSPTLIGQELYRAACDTLSRFEDFDAFIQQARGGSIGHINIGLVTTAKYVVPRILGAFYRQFPQVKVTLNIGNRAHILGRFERQEDDLYLFSHPPSGEQVLSARIIKNPLQLIAPKDHWAVGRQQVRFSELKQERFIIREPGSATRLMFESWCSAQGIALSETMQIESNEAIRLSVASGLGLSVISAHTLQEGREKPAILSVNGFPLESNWYLVGRRDKRLPYAAMQLVAFMATHLAECIEPEWVAADIQQLSAIFAPESLSW
ncbi:MAG: LysR family transcriptional regulator [Shewanella xiamenensis]|jgi:DNA-binding transcriptional LysR family regulator|uniref:LysR family transcriptional regulator n=1 Tax=Shewanella TaxID=22 RepID=UPI000B51CC38|nr:MULTISPECIES: LysR family transcriptional regulator [Shewanella]ASF17185.1 LysR family transcriptional regulator [Shewanella sp. FDAARGOS_354]MCD8560109.1 LysR family transcriptional regulator [Shewanella xiamenensis]MDH1627609.1 LysR family transcriptional regulator [Shewanella xiamenensis]QQK58908.1 LysR family transcriptional regulator [Shewanella sp. LC6]TPE55923.1 LysR family transcriptional regulator [Shewanella sp. LC2]